MLRGPDSTQMWNLSSWALAWWEREQEESWEGVQAVSGTPATLSAVFHILPQPRGRLVLCLLLKSTWGTGLTPFCVDRSGLWAGAQAACDSTFSGILNSRAQGPRPHSQALGCCCPVPYSEWAHLGCRPLMAGGCPLNLGEIQGTFLCQKRPLSWLAFLSQTRFQYREWYCTVALV